MLGQNGEAKQRVLSPSEAQQGESHCYAAVHDANQNYDLIKFFDSLSRGGEEEEKEEGVQEEEIEEAPGLPPTPGGRKGTSAKQANGGACCSLRFSLYKNHK